MSAGHVLVLTVAVAASAGAPARARLQALTAREAAITAELGASRTQLVRLLAALETLRRDPPPALLVSPGQARDAARAAILLHAIQPELERRARAFAARTRELNRVRREAAAADADLFTAESAQADRRSGPGALPGALPDARTSPNVAEAGPPAPPPARLLAPVPGPPTRRFGAPWPGRGQTQGWTWSPPAGVAVRAPAGGVVEYAGALKTWRLVVILRLEGGWRVVLAGLSTVTVAPGGVVATGATVGRAGAASAPGELYLELRHDAAPADPGPALAAGAR